MYNLYDRTVILIYNKSFNQFFEPFYYFKIIQLNFILVIINTFFYHNLILLLCIFRGLNNWKKKKLDGWKSPSGKVYKLYLVEFQ